jgi:predicted GNAT family N-acyltransferase
VSRGSEAARSDAFTLQSWRGAPKEREADLHAIGKLRVAAWRTEGGTPSIAAVGDCWLDHHDEHAIHFMLRRGDVLAAAARMCVHESLDDAPDAFALETAERPIPLPAAFFNRLVVEPGFRGQGLSDALDRERLHAASALRVRSVVVTTQAPHRITKLSALGFSDWGRASYDFASFLGPTWIFVKTTE